MPPSSRGCARAWSVPGRPRLPCHRPSPWPAGGYEGPGRGDARRGRVRASDSSVSARVPRACGSRVPCPHRPGARCSASSPTVACAWPALVRSGRLLARAVSSLSGPLGHPPGPQRADGHHRRSPLTIDARIRHGQPDERSGFALPWGRQQKQRPSRLPVEGDGSRQREPEDTVWGAGAGLSPKGTGQTTLVPMTVPAWRAIGRVGATARLARFARSPYRCVRAMCALNQSIN